MKTQLKKILPKVLINRLKNMINRYNLIKLFVQDYKNYKKSAYFYKRELNCDNLKGKIIMSSHSIEKGLSNTNIRLGFGSRALEKLFESLEEYVLRKYPTNDTDILSAISVIEEYSAYHQKHDYDTSTLIQRLRNITEQVSEGDGGIDKLKYESIIKHKDAPFNTFMKHRYSVRDFSDRDVEIDLIDEALELSRKTPSSCNRQAWMTYVIKDKDKISKILHKQAGLVKHRQDKVNTLILVVSNNSYYNDGSERNQGFIDGGIFAMNLLYSLTYVGLATCSLNAEMSINNTNYVKTLLRIPDNQNLIMFIAVGHYPEVFSVPKATRRKVEEFTTYYL